VRHPHVLLGLLTIGGSVFAPSLGYSWSNETTHPFMTTAASEGSAFERWLATAVPLIGDPNVAVYDADPLGTPLGGWSMRSWLEVGAELEDAPALRVLAHFHDPTKTWDKAGFWDSSMQSDYGISFAPSALLWATEDGTSLAKVGINEWNWNRARAHIYNALTSAAATDRSTELQWALRSLGQVAHLLQDMAVPAHVRNDSHFWAAITNGVIGFNIESWAAEQVTSCNGTLCLQDGTRFSESIPSASEDVMPFLRQYGVPYLWDSYHLRFGALPSASTQQGLAEYTSSNFFSLGTIFSGYDYPSRAGSHIVISPSGGESQLWCVKTEGDPTVLARGTQLGLWTAAMHWAELSPEDLEDLDAGEAAAILRDFARAVAGGKEVPCSDPANPLETTAASDWVLDSSLYRLHAGKLLPRAVGYSRALLDYFARGSLTVERSDQDHLRIRNGSAADMGGTLASKVTVFTDDSNGNRIALGAALILSTLPPSSDQYVDIPVPPQTEEVAKYVVVYQGQLGAEDNAVAARGIELGCPSLLPRWNAEKRRCESSGGGGSGTDTNTDTDTKTKTLTNTNTSSTSNTSTNTSTSTSTSTSTDTGSGTSTQTSTSTSTETRATCTFALDREGQGDFSVAGNLDGKDQVLDHVAVPNSWSVPCGDSVSVLAKADADNWRFDHWEWNLAEDIHGKTDPYFSEEIAQAVSLTGVFVPSACPEGSVHSVDGDANSACVCKANRGVTAKDEDENGIADNCVRCSLTATSHTRYVWQDCSCNGPGTTYPSEDGTHPSGSGEYCWPSQTSPACARDWEFGASIETTTSDTLGRPMSVVAGMSFDVKATVEKPENAAGVGSATLCFAGHYSWSATGRCSPSRGVILGSADLIASYTTEPGAFSYCTTVPLDANGSYVIQGRVGASASCDPSSSASASADVSLVECTQGP
jgi:hypothetical protein